MSAAFGRRPAKDKDKDKDKDKRGGGGGGAAFVGPEPVGFVLTRSTTLITRMCGS